MLITRVNENNTADYPLSFLANHGRVIARRMVIVNADLVVVNDFDVAIPRRAVRNGSFVSRHSSVDIGSRHVLGAAECAGAKDPKRSCTRYQKHRDYWQNEKPSIRTHEV